jgi:hypothetical protein
MSNKIMIKNETTILSDAISSSQSEDVDLNETTCSNEEVDVDLEEGEICDENQDQDYDQSSPSHHLNKRKSYSFGTNSKKFKNQENQDDLNEINDNNRLDRKQSSSSVSRKSFFITDILGLSGGSGESNKLANGEFTNVKNSSKEFPHNNSFLSSLASQYSTQNNLISPATNIFSNLLFKSSPFANGNNNANLNTSNERLFQQFHQMQQLQQFLPAFFPNLNPQDVLKFLTNFNSNENINNMNSNNQKPIKNNDFLVNNKTPLNLTPQKQPQQQSTPKKKTEDTIIASNSILSSLEQLTKNQFKDYDTSPIISSSKFNSIDSNSNNNNKNKQQSNQLNSNESLQNSHKVSTNNINNNNNNEIDKKLNKIDSQTTSKSNVNETDKKNENNTKSGNLWPAWVYCTRYSDRPSAGNCYCFY